ncbi:NAD-dependent 4,6-dehydratase LegB [bacterium]|nr:NAD-dependent 4,6-dehydratase LegB [bacterium]
MNILKVLITGAGGFIGSHLVEYCVDSGIQVKAFVRYNSKNYWGWLENSRYLKDIEVITGDIRDFDSVSKAVKGVDSVFHLAALIGIPYSYESPAAYIKTNIEGTNNILQASLMHAVGNVVVTSTSEVYGTAQYVPIDEKHPLSAQSPYAATKIAADQLALSFYRSFQLPVKIARPFNTFGPRQSARAVIPTVISQILNGMDEIKLGNIDPTRDFTYVKDTVRGFLAIAGCDTFLGEVVNIGMNKEISVGNLVEKIAQVMNRNITVSMAENRMRPSASEVERLMCDNSKILASTPWKPEYSLENGLRETVAWLKDNISHYKHTLYNI